VPQQVVIPLGQHIGAPAKALVKKGDKVKVGMLIGAAEGFVSANIHSSVSGTVNKIDVAPDVGGYYRPAIYIDVEGDAWEEGIDRSARLEKGCRLSPQEIIAQIVQGGIVGMGGAAFPTHVKLTPPVGQKAEVVVVNAAECEPYLTSDHALMMEKGEEILVGVTLLMKALGVTQGIVGIERNKADAIALLSRLVKGFVGIRIEALRTKYPQGGEKQLLDALIHRRVKSGALPISVGAVVQNVGTVYAVYEAVQKHKPLIERVVTLTGKTIARPSNILARIGTPVRCLIEAAGGIPEHTGKIIAGGPMMGKALTDVDTPVTKGLSGVTLLSSDESLRKAAHNCIRCAKCISVCPMGLNPAALMTAGEFAQWETAEKSHVVDCIECGACSYACPACRPLLDYIRLGKTTVTALIRARKT